MNCSFNIRYKPKTTRAFTKSDLTVYDSAGNTTLNALTVYGKSEVVDGAIVSAGEGWNTVDLGTLTWIYDADNQIFYAVVRGIKDATQALCSKYECITEIFVALQNNQLTTNRNTLGAGDYVIIKDTAYTDAATFKTAMSDVILAYQLADPTQGNTIAVKTDNGSGVDGTMAVFETGTPLRGIPDTNVRDVMAWDGSSGEVTKKCGVITLNGSETWREWAGTAFYCNPTMTAAVTVTNAQLPHLLSYLSAQTANDIFEQNAFGINVSNDTIRIRIENINNTSDLQTYLQSNPLTIVYELATPTTEQLTSTENNSIAGLKTFNPTTHAQNNAGADMTVDYTIRVPTI